MKRNLSILLILTPWLIHAMEPKELVKEESTLAKRYLEAKQEELPFLDEATSSLIAQNCLSPELTLCILRGIKLRSKQYIGHTAPVYHAMFNRTGDVIVTASEDNTAKLWNVATETLLHTLQGHTGLINSGAFNATGDKIVTGSEDHTARIWDVETGNLLHTIEGVKFVISFNPTGNKVITRFNDQTIKIWDVETGTLLHTLEGEDEREDTGFRFSPTGDKCLTSPINVVRIWDVETFNLLHTIVGVRTVDFNPTGNKIATGSNDRTAKIWDVETGNLLHTLEGHNDFVIEVAFNPTGAKIVTGSVDRTSKIWDVETGNLLHTLEGHTGPINSIAFSPTGDKIVTCEHLRDTAKIWVAETGTILFTLENTFRAIFTTSSDTIVKIDPNFNTIYIGKAETGNLLNSFNCDRAFAQLGNKVIFIRENTVMIIDIADLGQMEEYLENKITLPQAVLLNAILEVIKIRRVVKALGESAFEEESQSQSQENITFDLNRYPHLLIDYEQLPEPIKESLNPYIKKASTPSLLWQNIQERRVFAILLILTSFIIYSRKQKKESPTDEEFKQESLPTATHRPAQHVR